MVKTGIATKITSVILALATLLMIFKFPSFITLADAASAWSSDSPKTPEDGKIRHNVLAYIEGNEVNPYTQYSKNHKGQSTCFEFFILTKYNEENSTEQQRWEEPTYPCYCLNTLQYAGRAGSPGGNIYFDDKDFATKDLRYEYVLVVDSDGQIKPGEDADEVRNNARLAIQAIMMLDDTWGKRLCDGDVAMHRLVIQNAIWAASNGLFDYDHSVLRESTNVSEGNGHVWIGTHGDGSTYTRASTEYDFMYNDRNGSSWSDFDEIWNYYQELHSRAYKLYHILKEYNGNFSLSFNGNTGLMSYDDDIYSYTFENTKNYISPVDFDWNDALAGTGITYKIRGNEITFKSSKPLSSTTKIAAKLSMNGWVHYYNGLNILEPSEGMTAAYGSGVNGYAGKEKQHMVAYYDTKDYTMSVSLKTPEIPGKLELTKTSDSGNVSDIYFNIYKGSSTKGEKVPGTFKTDSSGKISADLAAGTYTIEEIVPAGYQGEDPKTIEIKSGQTTSVSFKNTKLTGGVEIIKQFIWKNTLDDLDINVSQDIEDAILEDIWFGIVSLDLDDPKGTDVSVNISLLGEEGLGAVVTYADGITAVTTKVNISGEVGYRLLIQNLPDGSYAIDEQYGDIASRYLDESERMSTQYFTVKSGESISISKEPIVNYPKTGDLTVKKRTEFGTVKDVQFRLKGIADLGFDINLLFGMDDYDSSWDRDFPIFGEVNGVIYKGTAEVASETGIITIKGLPYGSYTLTEVITNEYSVKSSYNYQAIIDSKNNSVKLTASEDTKQDAIENDYKRGNIRVTKRLPNSSGEPLAGFKFQVQGIAEIDTPDGPSTMDVTLVGTTNEDGIAEFLDVPIGHYTISEVDAADYYITPGTESFEVTENDDTKEFSYDKVKENYEKYGNLKIEKDIETSSGKTVPGEKFEFTLSGTSDSGDKVTCTVVTDSDGIAIIERIPIGTYTLTETQKPGYDVIDPVTIKITWDGMQYSSAGTKVKMQDGLADVFYKCTNKPVSGGSIELNKSFTYNSEEVQISDSLLPYIKFNLSGTTIDNESFSVEKPLSKRMVGDVVTYYVTFTDLPYGTYTITENLSNGVDKFVDVIKPLTVTIDSEHQTISKKCSDPILVGGLSFRKTIEQGELDGISFRLKGKSSTGIDIDLTAVIKKDEHSTQVVNYMGSVGGVRKEQSARIEVVNGTVKFSGIPAGMYTLTEENVPDYLQPMLPTLVTIEANKVTQIDDIPNTVLRGGLQINKTSDNDKIDGMWFRLSGISKAGEQVVLEGKTDKNGIVNFTDVPVGDNYTLEEFDSPGYFVPLSMQTGIIITAESVFKKPIHNEDKYGNLVVKKVIEQSRYPSHNDLSGFVFRLHGISDSGETVDVTATTDAEGYATFKHVLIAEINTYTLEEVSCPDRYVKADDQQVHIYWDGMDKDSKVILDEEKYNQQQARKYDIEVKNFLKYFSLNIQKVDEVTGLPVPFGDAKLEGAKYDVYKQIGDSLELLDTYLTDANGTIVTKKYECDAGYVVKEISPPVGYQLSNTEYSIDAKPTDDADYKLDTAYYTKSIAVKVTELPIMDQLTIHKIAVDGSLHGALETGAKFQIFLKSAGSYDAAPEEVRDIIIIGEDGNGTSKEMPYGIYTVHQIYAWDGYLFVADFDVDFNGNAKNFPVVLYNPLFKARVKVEKYDKESGGIIPLAGAGFRIYKSDEQGTKGELVKMHIAYPSEQEIEIFYTDASGTFMTPEELPYGFYLLEEVIPPEGYLLNTKLTLFEVKQENVKDPSQEMSYIEIKVSDIPQKGSVEIVKYGDVFADVEVDSHGLYKPLWSESALAGAEYTIKAKEDIVTPDGVVHYHKGDNVIAKLTTGNDGKAEASDLYLGEYQIIETKAPKGMVRDDEPIDFTLSYDDKKVTITVRTSQKDERQTLGLGIDKEMEQNETFSIGSNGEIEKVVFGLYANEELVAANGKSIPKDGLIQIAYCNAEGKISFNSEELPFGKYYIKELETDEHYLLNSDKFEFNFSYQGENLSFVDLKVNNGEAIPNDLLYGVVGGVKLDKETKAPVGNSLIGLFAKDETIFDKAHAILVAKTSEVDGSFEFINIPRGEYLLREIEAPEGYVLNPETFEVEIVRDNQVTETTILEDKIKGNIKLVKVDVDYSDVKLSGAIFSIYRDVNANSEIDDADVSLGALYEDNGTYYYNNLEYGHYLIQEVKAPQGYIQDSKVYSVFISENGVTYTISNKTVVNDDDVFGNKHIPEIGTKASIDGEKRVAANFRNTITITDVVSFKHLYIGKTYTLVGVLMDKATGSEFLVDGKPVISQVKFTPTTIDGEIDVTFTFDVDSLTGTTDLVVFETLYEGTYEWTSHKEITDEGQTVRLYKPDVRTTATVEGEKYYEIVDKIVIKDIVNYNSLIAGERYRIYGTLMDKATGSELLIDGKPVTNEVEFTAAAASGSVEVIFTFDASSLTGITETVVFEDLYIDDLKIATHADIEDKDQTVTLYKPEIKTTANINGEKDVNAVDTVKISDIVEYKNLVVGHTYKICGTLMDKATGEPLWINGKHITSETEFTPTKSDGYVTVEFTFDASALKGITEIVVFEDLYRADRLLTTHADLNDEGQMVRVYKPEIGTTATVNDEHDVNVTDKVTIRDLVMYHNLVSGKVYTMHGILIDKSTGEALIIKGKPVTNEVVFTAEDTDGTVIVEFTFDTDKLTDITEMVVFESLFEGDRELTAHADLEDENQTVRLYKPEVRTTADVNGNKDYEVTDEVVIKDNVAYKNLVAGKTYSLHGVLINKTTEKPLLINGETVMSDIEFTPDNMSGEVTIEFKFSADLTDIVTIVIFEYLSENDIELAAHADLEDENQTVRLYKPEIQTTADVDGNKEYHNPEDVTIHDRVYYHNLVINNQYTVRGVLMDKATGEPLMVDGEVIESKVVFTAYTNDGFVDVTFRFNTSILPDTATTVVFEDLYQDARQLATHADIEDIGQTVLFKRPQLKTTATVNEGKEEFVVDSIPELTIVDMVECHNLIIGKEYTISGVLMDKATGEPFLSNGEKVISAVKFTAEEENREIPIVFTVNVREITEDNTTLVAFETLMNNEIELAVHADIEDEAQTVELLKPSIGTQASIGDIVNGVIVITDTINYSNLIAGREYALKGTLMDKATGEQLLEDGESIVREMVFTPDNSSGSIQMLFEITQPAIHDDTCLVVFEKLYYNNVEIASHEDINSESQTVVIPGVPPETGFVGNTAMCMLSMAAAGVAVTKLSKKRKSK